MYLATKATPELGRDDGVLPVLVSLFNVNGRMALAIGCLCKWGAYGRTIYYMCLPFITAGTLLMSESIVHLVLSASKKTEWRQNHLRRSSAVRLEGPAMFGPLDSTGQSPCDHCNRTFAQWYCSNEERMLCPRCDAALHPRRNHSLCAHRRTKQQPRISQPTIRFRTIFMISLWEAYRLVGPATVVGVSQVFLCTDRICDGRTPETCARYLISDSAVACGTGSHITMLVVAIIAVVFWVALAPSISMTPVFKHYKRLHQEPVLLAWGFLYNTYNWYAAYWEWVVNVRKFSFVLIITIGYELAQDVLLGSLIIVCLVFISLELQVAPLHRPLSHSAHYPASTGHTAVRVRRALPLLMASASLPRGMRIHRT